MTPKKTFKNVCAGGHSVLIMKNVAMASSHAIIEMININLFMIVDYKRYVVLIIAKQKNPRKRVMTSSHL